MMPITPIGTLTFSILSPFLRVLPSRTIPIGSARAATCSTPSAIPFIRSGVSLNLSSKDSVRPAFFPFSMSISFAFIISSLCSRRAFAIAKSASSFLLPAVRKNTEAFFAFAPIISSCVISILLSGKELCSHIHSVKYIVKYIRICTVYNVALYPTLSCIIRCVQFCNHSARTSV